MPDDAKTSAPESGGKIDLGQPPLVFISHDSRDAAIAEAFSKLLKSVSAGMLKAFRSSDKKGTEGIEYGDEWYKRLMNKLSSASDVVCLFTERSINRPWILYEAGVAKGKLGTPVHGVALGVSLEQVAIGPFYQFQNCGDSEEELIKLVLQLAKRIPNLEPDEDVVRSQVKIFKGKQEEIFKDLTKETTPKRKEKPVELQTAKLLEEMKFIIRDLSAKIEDVESRPVVYKTKRMLNDLAIHRVDEFAATIPTPMAGLLVLASVIGDSIPILYDSTWEIYRLLSSGKPQNINKAFTLVENLKYSTDHPVIRRTVNSKIDYMAYMRIIEFLFEIVAKAKSEID